jgi:hypothetical protein
MTAVAKLTSAVAPSFEVAASGRLVGGWGRVAVAPAAVPVGRQRRWHSQQRCSRGHGVVAEAPGREREAMM